MRVMDLICFRCGEPWSLDDVLYEIRHAFHLVGSDVRCCPNCSSLKEVQLEEDKRKYLDDLRVIATVYGNDCNGFSYFLEEMHFN